MNRLKWTGGALAGLLMLGLTVSMERAQAGVGGSPPGLALSTIVEGFSLDIRMHEIARGQAGAAIQANVDIVGPDQPASHHVFKVWASELHTAHSAGLLLALATHYGEEGGFLSAETVHTYFTEADPQFALEIQRSTGRASNPGPPIVRVIKLIHAALEVPPLELEGPGGGCLERFESDLFQGLHYPPNPCLQRCSLDH